MMNPHKFLVKRLNSKNYITSKKIYSPKELNDLEGDLTKLRTITGWVPTYTFETMLDEMIDY